LPEQIVLILWIYNRLKKICMFLELYSPVTLRKIKSQLFLRKYDGCISIYFYRKLWSLHQAGSYGSSCNARSRDLSILVKEEEGIKGNFLTLKVQSLWQKLLKQF
jgi:hypothetical protein